MTPALWVAVAAALVAYLWAGVLITGTRERWSVREVLLVLFWPFALGFSCLLMLLSGIGNNREGRWR